MYKTYMMSSIKNADERNQRRPKFLKRQIMFPDWKTQHGKDVSSLPN